MNEFVKRLPDEIIHIISGYYGNRIPKDLSDDIKDYKIMYIIKNHEYYDKTFNIMRVGLVLNKLKIKPHFDMEKSIIITNKSINNTPMLWLQLRRQVNFLWALYSREDRQQIIKKQFYYYNQDDF